MKKLMIFFTVMMIGITSCAQTWVNFTSLTPTEPKSTIITSNSNQVKFNYQLEVTLTGMPSGIYFYSLFIDGSRIDTKKIIVQ